MGAAFDPATPDGRNGTPEAAFSADGTAEPGRQYEIPARCGVAVRLASGQGLVIENPTGAQVCDFWAFNAGDLDEHLSMEHLHTALGRIYPKPGDLLVSNRRRALLRFEEDSSPGVHDTVVAACDIDRYRQLGCKGYHDNCTDNLRMALTAIGLAAPAVPAPFNLWMNTPVGADGAIQWLAPVARSGDRVVFRAEVDCVVVMSACPQDMTPINGADRQPTGLRFHVES